MRFDNCCFAAVLSCPVEMRSLYALVEAAFMEVAPAADLSLVVVVTTPRVDMPVRLPGPQRAGGDQSEPG